jgi:hypothetical protein
MSKRGLKWLAGGVASLLLVLLGAHVAWEQHRYRLWTPRGAVRIGMTGEEVRALLGQSFNSGLNASGVSQYWVIDDAWSISVSYDDNSRVASASIFPLGGPDGGPATSIPRPSLAEHVRSWLPSDRIESEMSPPGAAPPPPSPPSPSPPP